MPTDVELIIGASPTLRARIFAKIIRGPSRDACYTWRGKFTRKRGSKRPAICIGGRRPDGRRPRVITVARLLLVLRDRVPLHLREAEELEAGHRCRNAECVNVRHLRWQTRSENEESKSEFEAFEAFAEAVDIAAASEAWEQAS
jgi:hypothetical protein